jgi:hypothetical protein
MHRSAGEQRCVKEERSRRNDSDVIVALAGTAETLKRRPPRAQYQQLFFRLCRRRRF